MLITVWMSILVRPGWRSVRNIEELVLVRSCWRPGNISTISSCCSHWLFRFCYSSRNRKSVATALNIKLIHSHFSSDHANKCAINAGYHEDLRITWDEVRANIPNFHFGDVQSDGLTAKTFQLWETFMMFPVQWEIKYDSVVLMIAPIREVLYSIVLFQKDLPLFIVYYDWREYKIKWLFAHHRKQLCFYWALAIDLWITETHTSYIVFYWSSVI